MKNKNIEKWEKQKRERSGDTKKEDEIPRVIYYILWIIALINIVFSGPPILYLLIIITPYLLKKFWEF